MKNHTRVTPVLFDLDGTLIDSADDLTLAINDVLLKHQQAPLSSAETRPLSALGSREMIKRGFGIDENHASFSDLRREFFNAYEQRFIENTVLFPEIDEILHYLTRENYAFGIVTNKPTRFTTPLIDKIFLNYRPYCVICGDTFPVAKPHPRPLLEACAKIEADPTKAVYIGDTIIDLLAAHRANMPALLAAYGYGYPQKIDDAPAHVVINTPSEIIAWLEQQIPAE